MRKLTLSRRHGSFCTCYVSSSEEEDDEPAGTSFVFSVSCHSDNARVQDGVNIARSISTLNRLPPDTRIGSIGTVCDVIAYCATRMDCKIISIPLPYTYIHRYQLRLFQGIHTDHLQLHPGNLSLVTPPTRSLDHRRPIFPASPATKPSTHSSN